MKISNFKHQISNNIQIGSSKIPNKIYDLEERTFQFAKNFSSYYKKIPRTVSNIEYGKQAIRSSGSSGSNYIEANEALSKKDFLMRIKISRKETKEARFWIYLTEPSKENQEEKDWLINEATELMNIFGSILRKSE